MSEPSLLDILLTTDGKGKQAKAEALEQLIDLRNDELMDEIVLLNGRADMEMKRRASVLDCLKQARTVAERFPDPETYGRSDEGVEEMNQSMDTILHFLREAINTLEAPLTATRSAEPQTPTSS